MVDLLGGLRGLQSGGVLLRHLPLLVPLLLCLQGGWLARIMASDQVHVQVLTPASPYSVSFCCGAWPL